ncbi:MAG: RNA polymerase-binding ATPase, partial [Thiopseudomonas sp.]|nr:RNA polymerase-binding ATPase [Thiopseudomonas sp.]
ESVPRSSASKFARAQRDTLLRLVDTAEANMQPRHNERVEQASAIFLASMEEEIARLTALQAINPSVRDEEIDTLRAYKEQGLSMFAKAALRLEAVRVLVAG